jgi:hypothetical protein
MIETSTLFVLIIFNLLFIECMLSGQKCETLQCKLAFQNLGYICFMFAVCVLLYSAYVYIENYCKRSTKREKLE